MQHPSVRRTAHGAVLAAAFLSTLFIAGCDDNVQTIRDSTIPVHKGMTWAWMPGAPPRDGQAGNSDNRPVISRDVIGRGGGETVSRENDPAVEIQRRELRAEIEKQLNAKGLTQISDPAAADFVLTYRFAVRGHNATVREVYPGGYGGLVCGPFGCAPGWGWGWGWYGYGPPAVVYRNVHFREGLFVLDMYQQETKRLAYQARGVEPAHRGQFSRDQIQDMVHALLKGLKVKG